MHRECAPAIRGLDGDIAPSLEDRTLGVKEGPVGGEGGAGVRCETNAAGHGGDTDGDDVREGESMMRALSLTGFLSWTWQRLRLISV